MHEAEQAVAPARLAQQAPRLLQVGHVQPAAASQAGRRQAARPRPAAPAAAGRAVASA